MAPERPPAARDAGDLTAVAAPPVPGPPPDPAPAAPPAPVPALVPRRDPVEGAARAAHAVSLAVAAPMLVWFNRSQWFFGDEWEFFANRMSGWGRVLFEPHNEHWSTAPILVYRALYAVAGLRTYVPYVVVLVVLHLATAHLLWRVMNRVGVAPLVATALAAVFAVLGSGAENLLWAFQIGFVGSVALGLVHLLLVDHAGPFGRRDRLAWAVAVAGLAFSGIAVTMTATSGLVVLLRRGPRDALATVAPPAAVYLLWFAAVGHEGLGRGGGRLADLLDAPAYLWTGLSAALEGASGIPGAGAVLVVVVIGWLLRQRAVFGTPRALATGMAAGAASLFVMLAAGRSGFGVEQATSSRYVYIAAALMLPAVGLMLSEATRHQPARQLVVAAVLVPVLVHNVAALREASHVEADREQAVRRQLAAAVALAGESDEKLAATVPEPRFTPDASVDVLRRLERDGALPDDRVGEPELLAAATVLQVALVDGPPPPAAAEPVPAVGAAVNDRGCLLVGPSGAMPVDVAFAGPDAVSLRTPTGGEVVVTVHSRSGSGVTGPPRTLTLRPGATEWLWVTRAGTITLTVPSPAATELCGVRPGAVGTVSS